MQKNNKEKRVECHIKCVSQFHSALLKLHRNQPRTLLHPQTSLEMKVPLICHLLCIPHFNDYSKGLESIHQQLYQLPLIPGS